MHVQAGVAVEAAGDRGMLMGGVIVGDDVDVELGRGLLIDGFAKGEPLLVAMARRQAGDQLALEIVERGKHGQAATRRRTRSPIYSPDSRPGERFRAIATGLTV